MAKFAKPLGSDGASDHGTFAVVYCEHVAKYKLPRVPPHTSTTALPLSEVIAVMQ
jgi:hypothetical protein